MGQTIGIVMYENEVGEKKAVIGMGLGMDEEVDTQRIASHGARLHLHQVEEIKKHLTNIEIK